jgi:hypothetical protein
MRYMAWLGGVAWLAIAVSLSGSAGAAGSDAEARARVVLVIDLAPEEGYLPGIIAEAHAIWRPYGISVVSSSAHDFRPGDIALAVNFTEVPVTATLSLRAVSGATDTRGRLGAIRFCGNGAPEPIISVDQAAVRALVARTGVGLWGTSPATVGRAIGRVLAHEIGHFLLAFPAHTKGGLLRASFNGQQLSELHRSSVALDRAMLPRLRARLAELSNVHSLSSPGNKCSADHSE